MKRTFVIQYACVIAALIMPSYAFADCTNPAAVESATFYNTSVNAIQFCNGSQWVNTGLKVPTATGTACTNPTADEGSVYYNTTANNVQFCNGDNWVKMGTGDYSSATGTACTSPAAPEGSIFYNTSYKRLQFCNGDNWVNTTYLDPNIFYGLETQMLLASDGADSHQFGRSVAISGDKAIIGAPYDDDNGSSSGSAYIFDVNTGAQLHKLLPSDGAASDFFGYSVAISGDKALVGSYRDDDNGGDSGSAYIFDVSTGAQLHKLLASDGLTNDQFGGSVAIDGGKAIIGAAHDDNNGSNSGSAYIFDVNTGAQLHRLLPSDGATNDQFGQSVAISGDKAIVGTPLDDDKGGESGSAYIFDVSTGGQLHKITASDGAADDRFGGSVSISGDKAIIASYWGDNNGSASGSAYIFDVSTAVQLYRLLPSDGAAGDVFGVSVSISGNEAIVGAYNDDDNGTQSGSAYIFEVSTGDQLHKLLPSNGAANDNFGGSVAIDGGKAIAGVALDDDNGSNSGSAYIFD